MSPKERKKTEGLHDYLFTKYSDEAGSLRFEDLPTAVRITEKAHGVCHEVSVRVVVMGLWPRESAVESFAFLLSYKRIALGTSMTDSNVLFGGMYTGS